MLCDKETSKYRPDDPHEIVVHHYSLLICKDGFFKVLKIF
jgi:hypothetical protein